MPHVSQYTLASAPVSRRASALLKMHITGRQAAAAVAQRPMPYVEQSLWATRCRTATVRKEFSDGKIVFRLLDLGSRGLRTHVGHHSTDAWNRWTCPEAGLQFSRKLIIKKRPCHWTLALSTLVGSVVREATRDLHQSSKGREQSSFDSKTADMFSLTKIVIRKSSA